MIRFQRPGEDEKVFIPKVWPLHAGQLIKMIYVTARLVVMLFDEPQSIFREKVGWVRAWCVLWVYLVVICSSCTPIDQVAKILKMGISHRPSEYCGNLLLLGVGRCLYWGQ